ncbi:hypothetical protein ACN28E_54955 [Archangium lansingense]|uniref:hypothetical protein n=1 Tax=Archangium lansingense TaxID=2995310 RepID=UPI003B81FF0A
MSQAFDELVRRAIQEAVRRRSAILLTPDANPVLWVLNALPAFIRSRPMTVSEASLLTQRAAELLVSQAPLSTDSDLLEALLAVAERSVQGFFLRREDQFAFLLVVKVAHRLGTRGALSPSSLAALLLESEVLDEELERRDSSRDPHYKLRALIVSELAEAFSTVSEELRHTDLVVRFKYALLVTRSSGTAISGGGGVCCARCPRTSPAAFKRPMMERQKAPAPMDALLMRGAGRAGPSRSARTRSPNRTARSGLCARRHSWHVGRY